MIESRIFRAIKCDRCGSYDGSEFIFWEDDSTCIDNAIESDWIISGDSHYCPDCWTYNDKDEKVILKPYPEHLKEVLKFLKTLDAQTSVVKETKDYFEILINFYRRDAPKSLRDHERDYINSIAPDKVLSIINRFNSTLIRVSAE